MTCAMKREAWTWYLPSHLVPAKWTIKQIKGCLFAPLSEAEAEQGKARGEPRRFVRTLSRPLCPALQGDDGAGKRQGEIVGDSIEPSAGLFARSPRWRQSRGRQGENFRDSTESSVGLFVPLSEAWTEEGKAGRYLLGIVRALGRPLRPALRGGGVTGESKERTSANRPSPRPPSLLRFPRRRWSRWEQVSDLLYHGFAEKYLKYLLASHFMKPKIKIGVDLLLEQWCYEDYLFELKSDFYIDLLCLHYIMFYEDNKYCFILC